MVNERQTERPGSLFSKTGRKGTGFAPKQPHSLVEQLESGRVWSLSAQPKKTSVGPIQPRAKMTTKEPTVVIKGHRRASSLGETTSTKNTTRFPPIPTSSLYTPRKAKVSFLPPSQHVMQRRRLSVPEESLNSLPKSILKKRHSVSVEFKPPAPNADQINMSAIWTLPWERELYLPPISRSGELVFLDEDGSLPPMLRRLSNADTYNYSQEFLQALDDLKNRPSSSSSSSKKHAKDTT